MLRQRTQGFLGRPAADRDLVKRPLAHLAQLLLLQEHDGPIAAPGIDRGQVEAE